MIDLSVLTVEEQKQFAEDDTTLMEGDTPVALYLRYSSERQSEQSIEGQLRDCIAYCKHKKYLITAIYVDRATTARKNIEKRVQFQQMLNDSAKHQWKLVIVWKLDRFARNREDSAISKTRLRRNGVRVESATEAIANTPEGIILESVLEGIAEYYSADLSQKITRGMNECALKCNSTGGTIPLGYKVENHKWVIDEKTAPIVREAFQLYADGVRIVDICNLFNSRGYRTARGAQFNKSSFKTMFTNRRYIGVYKYKDIEVEGGIPAIVDKETFDRAQVKSKDNHEKGARHKAKTEYMLSGKLYCGHCGELMVGESARSHGGRIYNYYVCPSVKFRHGCDKKRVSKDYIEKIVAQDAMEMLTDDVIEEMATMAYNLAEKEMKDNTHIPMLLEQLRDLSSRIANITKALEMSASETLATRLKELETQKKELTIQLEEEKRNILVIDKDLIVYWLNKFKNGDIDSPACRRKLINMMIKSVTIWDEPDGFRITITSYLTETGSKTINCSDSVENGSPLAAYPNILVMKTICALTKRHFL